MKVAARFWGVMKYHPCMKCVVLTSKKENIHEVELAIHGVNK
jgi:hypothetical protein